MTDPNPFETEDLRAWGYAPGSYVFKCQDCPADLDIYDKMGRLGDKRSWRCEEHARAARDATPALSQTLPAPGEVERIARDHVDAFKAQSRLGGLLDRDEALLVSLFSQAIFAASHTLATVAAANDEGVARKWASNDDPAGTLAIRLAATANEAEEEYGEWTWREIADEAIRLLSQGGGK